MVMEQLREEMDARAFIKIMKALLPGADSDALRSVACYALEAERDGDCTVTDYYIETYVEFNLITRHYGRELAHRLLGVCKTFALNPDELRGAANHLRYGVDPERIGPLALDGKCGRTEREMWEFDEAMDAFEDGVLKIPRRDKSTGNKAGRSLNAPAC